MIRRLALVAIMLSLATAAFSSQTVRLSAGVTQKGTISVGFAGEEPFLSNGILRVFDPSGKAFPQLSFKASIVKEGTIASYIVYSDSKRIGSLEVSSPIGEPDFATPEGYNTWKKTYMPENHTGLILSYTPTGKSQTIEYSTLLHWGKNPMKCRVQQEPTNSTLCQFVYGPGSSDRCNSLFDSITDSAISLGDRVLNFDPPIKWSREGNAWKLETGRLEADKNTWSFMSFGISRNYMKDIRGYKNYEPMDHSAFDKPVAGWCSWYSYGGGITEKDMVESTDWIANNLKQFGCEYVQLDDGFEDGSNTWTKWNDKFPHGGKWIADYIHSKGLKAGLWLNPFSTNDKALVDAHPDWFIHNAKGGTVGTFPSSYTLDCANPSVIDQWMKPLYKTLATDWGYDYFKHDGQTNVVEEYGRQNFNEQVTDRVEPYRIGLRAIRDVIGKNRFILSCCCAPREGMGIIDGTRIGSDVSATWGGFKPAFWCTRDKVFMNNIGWICDPDVVCVRDPLTLDQARLWVTFVGLTGQLFMTSDYMQKLPEERVELLRRAYPVAKIMPMDLYPLADAQLNTIDLKVKKPFGSWDVVGLFNYTTAPSTVALSTTSLSLPANKLGYAVYDFWNKQYLGIMNGPQQVDLPKTGCRLLAVTKVTGRPQVISTSRHITQGAVDLKAVNWDEKMGVLRGRSDVVGRDPYEIRIAVPDGYEAMAVLAYHSIAKFEAREGLVTVTIKSETNRDVYWEVQFAKNAK